VSKLQKTKLPHIAGAKTKGSGGSNKRKIQNKLTQSSDTEENETSQLRNALTISADTYWQLVKSSAACTTQSLVSGRESESESESEGPGEVMDIGPATDDSQRFQTQTVDMESQYHQVSSSDPQTDDSQETLCSVQRHAHAQISDSTLANLVKRSEAFRQDVLNKDRSDKRKYVSKKRKSLGQDKRTKTLLEKVCMGRGGGGGRERT